MIYNKDSQFLLEDIETCSVHAIITDPPYAINALGELTPWDKVLPPKEIWKDCYASLRPGGFCLVFSHTRMFHRMACLLEDTGFKMKDCLCWGYASGMPRSLNINKVIDKENKGLKEDESQYCRFAVDDEAKWHGWGTSLKVSWEPILLCQKPIEGRYIDNIRKYHVGALNIDECRIPYASEEDKKSLESFINFAGENHGDAKYFSANQGEKKQVNVHPDGRWPANLLWLDPLFADYDRMFMIPKPSGREKKNNTHPTVKPLHLMERLVKLVTPKPSVVGKDVVVLDPFCGSGTTGVACKRLGRNFIGYERDEESFEVAQKRIFEKVSHFDIFER